VVAVTIAVGRLHPAVDTVLDGRAGEDAARHPAATAVVGTTASAPDPLADPLHLLEVDVTLWKMTVLLKSRHYNNVLTILSMTLITFLLTMMTTMTMITMTTIPTP